MNTNLLKKQLTVGIILLFLGACIIPAIAQDIEKSSSISGGNCDIIHKVNTLYERGYELNPFNYFNKYVIKTNINNSFSFCKDIATDKKKINKCDDGWNIETVDMQGNTGKFTSITVDTDNKPHISYYDESNMDLEYAYKNGSNWTIQIVESEYDCGWTGSSHSLALDSNGNPHIVYIKWITGTSIRKVQYAKWNGTSFEISTVTETNNEETPFGYPSLALDASNNPHIVYIYQKYPFNLNYGGVKYVRFNNTSWEFENICESCPYYSATGTTIVIDSEENPHVNYVKAIQFNPFAMDLEYAYRTSRGWNIEVVDSGTECWFSCIAIDSNNIPYISYNKGTIFIDAPYELKCARRSDKAWINSTLEIGDCKHTSIIIDSNDNPHISYMGMLSYGSALKHAWWDGTEWIFSVVDTGDYKFTGLYTSTAIDSQGICHISYYDGTSGETEGNLKYAWGENIIPNNTPPNPPFIFGTQKGKVGQHYDYNISSMDPDGDDVYYYIDWGDGTFEYTKRFPSSLEITKEHWWNTKGTYIIKTKAIDLYNAESEWGTLEIKMPSIKLMTSRFINFIVRFPHAFPILRQMVRY